MNKKTTLIILILLSIFITGCEKSNMKQINTEATVNKQGVTNSSQPRNETTVSAITQKEVQSYFTMTKSDIIKVFGTEYTEETHTIDGIHAPLTVIAYKNGLTFYGLNDDNSKPTRIECSDGFQIMGLKNGMTFSQIENILGKKEISETWISTEDNKAYKIEYNFDGFQLRVLSMNEEGTGSYLAFCQSTDNTSTTMKHDKKLTYTKYENKKYGFSIEYPSDFTTKIPSKEHNYETEVLPGSDYGKDLMSPDWKTELIIQGDRIDNQDTIQEQYNFILGRHPDATYKKQEGNWFVVSWFGTAEYRQIVYLKTIIEKDHLASFELFYPADKKDYYDQVISHLNSTFKISTNTDN